MNYVVFYTTKYGLVNYSYMNGKNSDEVKTIFTATYPDRDILGIYASVSDMKTVMQAFIDFI